MPEPPNLLSDLGAAVAAATQGMRTALPPSDPVQPPSEVPPPPKSNEQSDTDNSVILGVVCPLLVAVFAVGVAVIVAEKYYWGGGLTMGSGVGLLFAVRRLRGKRLRFPRPVLAMMGLAFGLVMVTWGLLGYEIWSRPSAPLPPKAANNAAPKPIPPASLPTPVLTRPPEVPAPPAKTAPPYTETERNNLRDTMRELTQILNVDGSDVTTKINNSLERWDSIYNTGQISSPQEFRERLEALLEAVNKLRMSLKDSNGPLQDNWNYHDEIFSVTKISDQIYDYADPISGLIGAINKFLQLAVTMEMAAKYNDKGLVKRLAMTDTERLRSFQSAQANYLDWLKQTNENIAGFRSTLK